MFENENVYAEEFAKAEIVVNLETETVVHEHNPNERLPMASTTKIMTAIIIIEECDLEEEITVSPQAIGVEGSSIYLKYNERISIKDLLYGLLMRSGNDCAAALAIHHSGSVEKFVNKMNEKAFGLKLNDTHFENPSGLPNNNHYTTAYDLAKLSIYCMKNQTFQDIVSCKRYKGKYRTYIYKNKMLTDFEGANGVKTGYTLKAGRCLISSARRGNMDFICVVLNCVDMYNRSKNLLNQAFEKYDLLEINQDIVFMSDRVPYIIENNINILVPRNGNIVYHIEQDNSNSSKNNAILNIYNENNLIFSGKLCSI